MKERPMLFGAPMVRALLAGSKTQTRRVMKPQPTRIGDTTILEYRGGLYQPEKLPSNSNLLNHCPYGQPGGHIWVRETFQGPLFSGEYLDEFNRDSSRFETPEFCVYAADGGGAPEFQDADDNLVCRWRPSIHMPRWASRIMLEIVSVRVERLNDCSEADALAEGVKAESCDHVRLSCEEIGCCGPTAKGMYAALWEQINGVGAWADNPWVWVIEFKRVTP